MIRGECPAAAGIAERMLAISSQSGSEVQHLNARMWAMIVAHHMGDLLIAQRHADVCIQTGTPANQAGRLTSIFDPVVATLAESSRNLWMLGDTRGCIERARRAVELAREIRHPDSLAFALIFHGWMHGYREDWETCLRSTAEGIALGVRYGLAQTSAWNHCIHGWALTHTGNPADGLAELQSGMEDSARIWGKIAMTQFCAMLSEVLLLRGDHARALEEIRHMLTLNETSRDLYVNAELHRLAGECQRALGEPEAAEASLQKAIETARAQGAKTFELRAATARGQLWAARNQRDRASTLLQATYDALGDAEDTVDVLRARACLREWS